MPCREPNPVPTGRPAVRARSDLSTDRRQPRLPDPTPGGPGPVAPRCGRPPQCPPRVLLPRGARYPPLVLATVGELGPYSKPAISTASVSHTERPSRRRPEAATV